jgi:hypothetical protein
MTDRTITPTRYKHALLYLGGSPEDDRPTVMFSFGKAGVTADEGEEQLRAEAWNRGYAEYGTFFYAPVTEAPA